MSKNTIDPYDESKTTEAIALDVTLMVAMVFQLFNLVVKAIPVSRLIAFLVDKRWLRFVLFFLLAFFLLLYANNNFWLIFQFWG